MEVDSDYLKKRLSELGVAHFVSSDCIQELAQEAEKFVAIIASQSGKNQRLELTKGAMNSIAMLVYGYFYPHDSEKVLGPHAKILSGWNSHPIFSILDKHSTGGKSGK